MKTLAMMKMEKNFRAHIEKKYPRKPYEHYNLEFWIYRLKQELQELTKGYENRDVENIREELADISNLVDYAFERTFIEDFSDEPIPNAGLGQLFEHNEKLKGVGGACKPLTIPEERRMLDGRTGDY